MDNKNNNQQVKTLESQKRDGWSASRSIALLCPDCSQVMQLYDEPKIIFEIKIPFTDKTIQVWDWSSKEYMCLECVSDKNKACCEAAYYAGGEDGYQDGLRAAREERY